MWTVDPDQTAPVSSLICFIKRLLNLLNSLQNQTIFVVIGALTLKAPIATKVVGFLVC